MMSTVRKTIETLESVKRKQELTKPVRRLLKAVAELNGMRKLVQRMERLGSFKATSVLRLPRGIEGEFEAIQNFEFGLSEQIYSYEGRLGEAFIDLQEAANPESYLEAVLHVKPLSGKQLFRLQKTLYTRKHHPMHDLDELAAGERIETNLFVSDDLTRPLEMPCGTGPLNADQAEALYVHVVNTLAANRFPPVILDQILCCSGMSPGAIWDWLAAAKLRCCWGGTLWGTRNFLEQEQIPLQPVIEWIVGEGAECDFGVIALLCRGNKQFYELHQH